MNIAAREEHARILGREQSISGIEYCLASQLLLINIKTYGCIMEL